MDTKKGLKDLGKTIMGPAKQVGKMGEEVAKAVSSPFIQDKQKLTIGEKTSDLLTKWAGSWFFIILFFIFLGLWMSANVYAWTQEWDPYPFILLNLVLSCLAAIQAPVILMSQNRTNQKDRLRTEYDYSVNRKAEKEIQEIKKLLMKRRRR